MSPAEYMTEIVLPTVEEFMAMTGNRRRGYLACIAAAHVPDYIAKADFGRADQFRQRVAARGDWFSDCVAIVTGICNGSKHAGRSRDAGAFKFEAGSERHVEAFTLDKLGAGLDEGRWGRDGLMVRHRGFEFFVDDCLNGMLHGLTAEFPTSFEGVEFGPAVKGASVFAGFHSKANR